MKISYVSNSVKKFIFFSVKTQRPRWAKAVLNNASVVRVLALPVRKTYHKATTIRPWRICTQLDQKWMPFCWGSTSLYSLPFSLITYFLHFFKPFSDMLILELRLQTSSLFSTLIFKWLQCSDFTYYLYTYSSQFYIFSLALSQLPIQVSVRQQIAISNVMCPK